MRASPSTAGPSSEPRGDAAAGDQLGEAEIRALEPVLRVFARRAVGDDATAQDLVQDALVGAVQNLPTFDRRSQLRTWVVGILSHKIVDHLRRTRLRRWESDEVLDDAVLAPRWTRTPESELTHKQALGALERALVQLPDRERMAVMLCDVEGLDRDAVCNALGVGATHLRVLLHRARHRLRKALEDAGV